ncbi:hypothetical protein ACIQVC_12990 [Streptomyces sp. NPDC101112]|uniref:hypothetical protein n=1 Tax=Streptomyces sp. NPDC101112 TaxID=3366105 RepID=UPI0038042E2D
MTQRSATTPLAGIAPPPADGTSPTPRSAAPSPGAPGAPGVGRLIALDLARGPAVLGMYTAHVGPDPGGQESGQSSWAASSAASASGTSGS